MTWWEVLVIVLVVAQLTGLYGVISGYRQTERRLTRQLDNAVLNRDLAWERCRKLEQQMDGLRAAQRAAEADIVRAVVYLARQEEAG